MRARKRSTNSSAGSQMTPPLTTQWRRVTFLATEFGSVERSPLSPDLLQDWATFRAPWQRSGRGDLRNLISEPGPRAVRGCDEGRDPRLLTDRDGHCSRGRFGCAVARTEREGILASKILVGRVDKGSCRGIQREYSFLRRAQYSIRECISIDVNGLDDRTRRLIRRSRERLHARAGRPVLTSSRRCSVRKRPRCSCRIHSASG